MTEVTRGEFDMLRTIVSANQGRLDSIDATGTRGVGVLQTQITDLAKDVAGLSARMDRHDEDHKRDEAARRAARRWMIATAIAALTAVEGPLVYVITHLHG